jgi:hypothetical protein
MFYDKDFLLQLDKEKNKIIHAKVTALTFNELPIESVEGRVTQGSINVDGTSAVRRTCSLTMIAHNFDYQNYYWGINTKFKLEVGVENHINPAYPDIIWFNQGIYVFTSFNTSRSTNNFTISLQGKDKMCLLNGEVGGSLESSVDFGNIEEEVEPGVWQITPIPIYEIIRNAVHTYAGEPYHNIIINDLDDLGLELLEYRYDIPMYLYREIDSPIFANILLNGNKECVVHRYNEETEEMEPVTTKLSDLTPNELDMLVETLTGTSDPAIVEIEGKPYYVAKVEYGQTAGYRHTDLTYAGDLIANVGESIVSVLDKIKNMLSEFEYFYDLNGQFIFQKKRSFINTLYTPMAEALTENEDLDGLYNSEKYVESVATSSSISYVFNDGELITTFNNNPNLLNMRNDFSVWGNRISAAGKEYPVHLRYAIDTKPKYYKALDGKLYMTDRSVIEEMKEAAKQGITDKYFDKIKNFQLEHNDPRFGLQTPEKQEDGSWSPGWWDIRDWYNYYFLLTNSYPNYTMKWYSQNDETGVVPVNTLPGLEDRSPEAMAWTIQISEIDENSYRISTGHGSGGSLGPSSWGDSLRYESYYDENGTCRTKVSVIPASVYTPGKRYFVKDSSYIYEYSEVRGQLSQEEIDKGFYYEGVTKNIINPYNGCSD